jgi:predicted nucleotide-binding protein
MLTDKDRKELVTKFGECATQLRSFDVNQIVGREQPPELQGLARKIDRLLEKAFGAGSTDYNRFHSATALYCMLPISMGYPGMGDYSIAEIRQNYGSQISEASVALQGAIEALEDDMTGSDAAVAQRTAFETSDDIFVVHGHDHTALHEVARLLERSGLNPIILHEKPNQGKTIIEKFEANSSSAGFAVVLLTGDDVGGLNVNELQPRARQNVILELGYFVGKLSRARVCALKADGVELPSDLLGVGYVPLDGGGAWKFKLAQELKAAGYDIDFNKFA